MTDPFDKLIDILDCIPEGPPLCPSCEHASHDWCNTRPEITEVQTECSQYKPMW